MTKLIVTSNRQYQLLTVASKSGVVMPRGSVSRIVSNFHGTGNLFPLSFFWHRVV